MRIIRYLGKNLNLINILLLAGIVVLAATVLYPMTYARVKFALPRAKVKAPVEAAKEAPGQPAQQAAPGPSPLDYAVIGEQNLFHPDRVTPIDGKAEVPKPELILYGTLITDIGRTAFIEDKRSPKTSPGRGKRQTTVRLGEIIGGYRVTEIEPDRIVLIHADEKVTFYLSSDKVREGDASSPVPAGKTPPLPVPAKRPTVPGQPAASMPLPGPGGNTIQPERTAAPPIPRGISLGGQGMPAAVPGKK